MTVAAPLASHHRARSRRSTVLRDAVAELAVGHDVIRRGPLLLTSGTVTSVSRAAAASGFTHHGRFAAAYRARYGELPSSTLSHR